MVKLTHDGMKGGREFDIDHAIRLLNMPNNGGWKPYKKADSKAIEEYQNQQNEPDHNGNKSDTEESEGEG